MAAIPPITMAIEVTDLDALRALTEAIAEATDKLHQATLEVVRLLEAVQGTKVGDPDPGMETVLCQVCTGTGLPTEGPGSCLTCQGHGVVQQALQVAMTAPLDTEILTGIASTETVPENQREVLGFGDVPMPTMPRKATTVTMMTGLDPTTLCPECRQGKCRNCTRDGQAGEEPCTIWARYLDETDGVSSSFPSWLTERGLA